jgi:hypothetical protein
MRGRWRGRSAALAVVAAALTLSIGAAAVGRTSATLYISLPDGRVVASVPLPEDGALALRYRNSLYGTLAEERFTVTDDGRLRLVGLRAEQLAVLEEYYAIDTPADRIGTDGMAWEARPARGSPIRTLRVAATDRGERTLLVAGHEPIELWRYVEDTAPSVMLEVER